MRVVMCCLFWAHGTQNKLFASPPRINLTAGLAETIGSRVKTASQLKLLPQLLQSPGILCTGTLSRTYMLVTSPCSRGDYSEKGD